MTFHQALIAAARIAYRLKGRAAVSVVRHDDGTWAYRVGEVIDAQGPQRCPAVLQDELLYRRS